MRRFARADSLEELLSVPLTGRPSLLDEHRQFHSGHDPDPLQPSEKLVGHRVETGGAGAMG